MLELARTLVANPAHRLAAPLVFLFNGGEETLSQAANGFFASSRCEPFGLVIACMQDWQGRPHPPTRSPPIL